MTRWFGDRARPAADIDLQVFAAQQPGLQSPAALIERCRRACWYADLSAPEDNAAIWFDDVPAPAGGESLWNYGTPGERTFAGWFTRNGARGHLQIDIAASRVLRLEQIETEQTDFVAPAGAFQFLTYTPEMLLAAKLSWLLRGLDRQVTRAGIRPPKWRGEPKDLFDAHLLLTRDNLRPAELQRALVAVGDEDELKWSRLDALFDVRRAPLADRDFANWPAFAQANEAVVRGGPGAMLIEIAARLEPLLGDLYRAEEAALIQAIHADPVDESGYAIYADWLEERGDPRARFLRIYAARHFHRPLPPELLALVIEIEAETPLAWLVRLFETNARAREALRTPEPREAWWRRWF
jgi:uncharacterized protein (TIGR02996 family)